MHECPNCGYVCCCDGEDVWNDVAAKHCKCDCDQGWYTFGDGEPEDEEDDYLEYREEDDSDFDEEVEGG